MSSSESEFRDQHAFPVPDGGVGAGVERFHLVRHQSLNVDAPPPCAAISLATLYFEHVLKRANLEAISSATRINIRFRQREAMREHAACPSFHQRLELQIRAWSAGRSLEICLILLG
jgi:hypothetical protein